MVKVVLYSTHCPKCCVLERKLKQKGVEYIEVNDIETMKQKGYDSVPVLEIDDVPLDFSKAAEWINNF